MSNLPFRPIIGTEQKILNVPEIYRNGLFGIASDTNRIYYGDDGRMHLIGSKSNIYYGNMHLTETPDANQTEFLFTLEEIEGNESVENNDYIIPNESDLILNTDGCFYKVLEVIVDGNSTVLNTKKLTIAGSGGGGGNTPGGGSSSTVFNRITSRDIEVLYGGECKIEYQFSATDSSGEPTGAGDVEVVINGVSALKTRQEQGRNFVDVGNYLSLAENQSVVIKITVDTGTGVPTVMTKSWSVTTRRIELIWDYNETAVNTDDTITLSWTVNGTGTKTTTIIIDGDDSNPIIITSDSSTLQTKSINRREYGLMHGVHSITMQVSVQIGNSTPPPTEPITKYFICADQGEKAIIIANLLKTNQSKQYDTLSIPLVVYNPTSETSVVELYNDASDTIPIDTWNNFPNETKKPWLYTPTTAGEKRLKVRCGSTNLIINLNIESIGADISEVENYAFKLKASDFTSNDALRAIKKTDGTPLLTFSENFDWIRGGLKSELDENGQHRQYICVPAGSTMTINQALFLKEAANYGKNIKIIFKAVNCRTYDGLVMKCGSSLELNAQSASLISGSTRVDIPYCEDSYLELEYDIWAVNETTGVNDKYRYIVGWLDGVPCCASAYTLALFASNDLLEIGSPYCDVQVYLIKSYDRHLSNDEHIKNFIADAPNSNEMLTRYRRNDILEDGGTEISYLKLAAAAPDCRVHVYDIPRMTLNKDDKVKNCSYTMYHGSQDAVIHSDAQVTMRVQGTSSAAYGIAAFNVDCDFKPAIEAGQFTAEQLTDAVLGNKAIPCTYFTTKVNVASCEGANNALNQEWYNLHQPHKMALRQKNKSGGWNGTGRLYRDTMQFEPGVMFVIDRNPETGKGGNGDNVFKDTEGYIANPYPKMYSICNMGNSKKNTHVFHDEENPRECCVEVADNQLVEQRMLHYRDAFKWNEGKYAWTSIGLDGKTDAKVFEFRYPDAKDVYTEGTEAQKSQMDQSREDWTRFFTWMGKCNLQPYNVTTNPNGYNENSIYKPVTLIASTYTPDTYYIRTAGGVYEKATGDFDNTIIYYSDAEISYGVFTVHQDGLLKGVSVDTFAGVYTHDTREYRFAKMLSECEDYLCLDSVVYHYLMIERHSMIDNVAKNTFWSTEDGIHWNLNKDYDNDTADGIDNNGLLKLTYGVEGGDSDIGGTPYFNAYTTVWFNFIKELLPLQTKLYIALDTDRYDDDGKTKIHSAWQIDEYLNKFTTWQNCIPERCWVEDYYRKYFRPAEVYGDKTYLPRLDGGKKTHQRKQYETYQHTYIDSKFGGSTTLSGNIQLRANAQVANSNKVSVPVTFYADCYLNAAIGSGTGEQTAINYRQRIKRGEIVNFSFDIAGDLTDATCYFYLPQYYTTIGDLSVFSPKLVSITNARKLREVTLGDSIENTEANAVITISEQAVPLLEKLIAKNIKSLDSDSTSLSLADATSLKELDLTNSAFGDITLPDGAPLEKLRLNKPTAILASNLYKLNEFTVQDCSMLSNIRLNSVDTQNARMSQILIQKLKDANSTVLNAYNLQNIDWNLTNSTDLIREIKTQIELSEATYEPGKYYYLNEWDEYVLDNNENYDDTKTYYIINNYMILLFDYLLTLSENKLNPIEPHIGQMSGIVNIAETAYNSNDSMGFYTKYMMDGLNGDATKRYPLVDLQFAGSQATLYDVTIHYDGEEGRRAWSKKAVNGTLLNSTFLSTGPAGAFNIGNVYKDQSLQHTYIFTGEWNVYNADTNELINGIPITDLSNSGISISCNLKIVPIFTEVTRKYPVIIYNDDGTTILQDFSDEANWIEYGTTVNDILSTTIPTTTKDISKLQLEEIYAFKGYSVVQGSTTVINDDYKVEGEETLYAVYELKNIYDVDFKKYFTYIDSKAYTEDLHGDANYNKPAGAGLVVVPNAGYTLSGKILIPAYFNNKPVLGIGAFNKANWNITHIFIENPVTQPKNPLTWIADQAFQGVSSLKYFDFNNAVNLRTIGKEVFQNCSLSAKLMRVMGGEITYSIGDRAFHLCLQDLDGQIIQLPSSVKLLHDQAFMGYGSNLSIEIGASNNLSELDLTASLGSGDNFARIEAKNIIFYTNKYSSGEDYVGNDCTVADLLKGSLTITGGQ